MIHLNVALLDARKAVSFAKEIKVPVMGKTAQAIEGIIDKIIARPESVEEKK